MILYIDISAVSYVIPLVAAVVVAVGSWLVIHFHRAKTKVSKTLGIDENAHKEVEEDIVINEEAIGEAVEKAENAADNVSGMADETADTIKND